MEKEKIKGFPAAIAAEWKYALITFFTAVICNLPFIVHELTYADVNTFTELRISNYWELSLGRWMLPYIDHFRWGVASPVVGGVLASAYLAIAGVLLIRLFHIERPFFKVMTCLYLAVAPFFYEVLGSLHCESEFILGFLLSVLCIYCLDFFEDKRIGILFGSVCLACSLGIYQSYVGVSCGLCLLRALTSVLKEKAPCIETIKKVFHTSIMGVLGVFLYMLALMVNLKLWNWQLESYSGADQVLGIHTVFGIPGLMKDALNSFNQYFFGDSIINNTAYSRGVMNGLIFALAITIVAALFIMRLRECKGRREQGYALMLLICCVGALPFALGVIELIISERNINQLMCAPYTLIYVFIIALLDGYRLTFGRSWLNSAKKCQSIVMVILLVIILQSFFVMDSASSMATKIKINQTKLVATNIIQTIYENEAYYVDMPIIFIGSTGDKYFQSSSKIYDMASGDVARCGQIWSTPSLINNNWYHFIRFQMGVDLNLVQDTETYFTIVNTERFDEMPVYPAKGSVAEIDGIMAVKLTANPDKE